MSDPHPADGSYIVTQEDPPPQIEFEVHITGDLAEKNGETYKWNGNSWQKWNPAPPPDGTFSMVTFGLDEYEDEGRVYTETDATGSPAKVYRGTWRPKE
jgi:hypothetical protein